MFVNPSADKISRMLRDSQRENEDNPQPMLRGEWLKSPDGKDTVVLVDGYNVVHDDILRRLPKSIFNSDVEEIGFHLAMKDNEPPPFELMPTHTKYPFGRFIIHAPKTLLETEWAKRVARITKAWNEAEHPRDPAGTSTGGQFTSTGDATSYGEKEFRAAGFQYNLEMDDIWNEHVRMDPEEFRSGMLGPLRTSITKFIKYGKAVKFTTFLDDGVQGGQATGYMERLFYFDDKTVRHGSLALATAEQGKGVAKAVLASEFALYQKLGLQRITLKADVKVGRYAWAKYGFTPDREGWNELRHSYDLKGIEVDPALRRILDNDDPRAIWALSDHPKGKRLLMQHEWEGELRFDDEKAMARFHAYVSKGK